MAFENLLLCFAISFKPMAPRRLRRGAPTRFAATFPSHSARPFVRLATPQYAGPKRPAHHEIECFPATTLVAFGVTTIVVIRCAGYGESARTRTRRDRVGRSADLDVAGVEPLRVCVESGAGHQSVRAHVVEDPRWFY